MIIYSAIGKDNSVYIGATLRSIKVRIAEHKSHSIVAKKAGKFYESIRLNGIDFFSFTELSKANSAYELYALEKDFILLFDSYNNGLNGSTGGKENKGIKVTQKRINAAKRQMLNIHNSEAIVKARKRSLTPEKQKERSRKSHEKKRLSMPLYGIFCRQTDRILGKFRGYKECSEVYGYHPATIRQGLVKGVPTRKYYFRYMEV